MRLDILRLLPVGECMDWWLDEWGHVKSLKIEKNLELIEIFLFCLKIDDLWRQPFTIKMSMHGQPSTYT